MKVEPHKKDSFLNCTWTRTDERMHTYPININANTVHSAAMFQTHVSKTIAKIQTKLIGDLVLVKRNVLLKEFVTLFSRKL